MQRTMGTHINPIQLPVDVLWEASGRFWSDEEAGDSERVPVGHSRKMSMRMDENSRETVIVGVP